MTDRHRPGYYKEYAKKTGKKTDIVRDITKNMLRKPGKKTDIVQDIITTIMPHILRDLREDIPKDMLTGICQKAE